MSRKTEPEKERWWVEVVPERRFGIEGWRAVAYSDRGGRLGNMECLGGGCFAKGYWRRRPQKARALVYRDLRKHQERLESERRREEQTMVFPWEPNSGTL